MVLTLLEGFATMAHQVLEEQLGYDTNHKQGVQTT